MFRIGEYKNDFYFPHSITEAHLQHTPAQVFFLKKYIVFICGLTQETFLILNIFPWYTPTIQIGSVFLAEVDKQIFKRSIFKNKKLIPAVGKIIFSSPELKLPAAAHNFTSTYHGLTPF